MNRTRQMKLRASSMLATDILHLSWHTTLALTRHCILHLGHRARSNTFIWGFSQPALGRCRFSAVEAV